MTPAAEDDPPIFDEVPLRAVAFAPREIRPPSRRGPLVAGAWAFGLVAIVGIGLLAGLPSATPAPKTELDQPTFLPGEIDWPPQGVAHDSGAIVVLSSPALPRVVVTTDRLQVAGTMLVRAARVEIALEARGNRVLDHVSVDVGNTDGGIRPEHGPTFGATFDLPYPRPNGTMWVVVTAYDDGGMLLGATRRPFEVGPLVEVPLPRAGGNPMSELWRPHLRIAGLGLAAPPPTCMPVSPTLASSC